MAGAEEFRAFSPSIRDNMYLPDEHMTQDIMASGTRRKLADLQRVGDIQAEAMRTPYDAMTKGFNAFQEGKQRGLNAEEQKQQMRQRSETHGQDMEKGQIGLQRDRAAQAEENAYRDFLNKSDTEGGKSRREQMNTADFTSHVRAPQNAQDEHDARMKEIDLQMKQANAALGQMGMNARDHAEAKARQDAQDGFSGIYADQTMTPEQKEAKATAFEQSLNGGKVPGPVVTSYRMAAKNGANAAAQQGALQNQFMTQGTDTYQHMAQSTQGASADVDSIQQLATLRNGYTKNLRFGPAGAVLGKAGGESDVAANQRNEFASTLDAMGKHDLADNIRGSSPRDVSSRMNDVIANLSMQTKANWQHQKSSIHPSMANRPEVAQTDQKVQGLDGLTAAGAEKNNVSLAPGAGMGGSGSNRTFLTGGGAPPPGGPAPTGGGLVPAGYNPQLPPGQNAGAHGAGALPVKGGTLKLPPHPGQAPAAAPMPQQPMQQPFGGAPLPGQVPPAYGYDFSKYRVNNQMPAAGVGLGGGQ